MNRFFIFLAQAGLLFNAAAVHSADITMPQLMQLFSASKSIKADFVEYKYVKILDAPVESSGELLFQAPDRLEKRTKRPRPETMLIEANRVSIERPSFKRAMQLDEYPDIASMVQSLTATFRGDTAGIEKYFSWSLKGTPQKWQLSLKPKNTKMMVTLREILLTGENNYIRTVETTLTDGDYSVMTLSRPEHSNTQ
jgi:outer membrane lipoprotein-sorting protein